MAKFGKWVGAGLGWAFGGPIGALIGLGLGWAFDSAEHQDIEKNYTHTTPGDFALSLIVLIAAVMKADGKIMQSELNYVKAFLIQRFGVESANEALKMLRNILGQQIHIEEICLQIRQRLDYSSRLELIHLLYGVANADGSISEDETRIIEKIGNYMGVSYAEQQSIKNMFYKSTESAYKILGVEKNATEEDIKKAYRKLAIQHHPDKVSYLGDDIKKSAEDKFRKINEAYETIKKERGIK